VFRDSRGVVHTVSSADPLEDLPSGAASALSRALLVPTRGDLGGALERCEAARELLDRWQDAFFAALPADLDLEEEARWAAEAGLSLAEVEAQWEDEDDDWDAEEAPGQLDLEEIDLTELTPLADEPPGLFELEEPTEHDVLGEELVAELEVALLLLPLRVRLEALVAAASLVDDWSDLLADHEKCLGHLVLKHGAAPEALPHDILVDRHAALHVDGPGHPGAVRR
jgi:hypothetical protein